MLSTIKSKLALHAKTPLPAPPQSSDLVLFSQDSDDQPGHPITSSMASHCQEQLCRTAMLVPKDAHVPHWPKGPSPGTPIHTALCPHLSPVLDLALPLLALCCSAPVSCTPGMPRYQGSASSLRILFQGVTAGHAAANIPWSWVCAPLLCCCSPFRDLFTSLCVPQGQLGSVIAVGACTPKHQPSLVTAPLCLNFLQNQLHRLRCGSWCKEQEQRKRVPPSTCPGSLEE